MPPRPRHDAGADKAPGATSRPAQRCGCAIRRCIVLGISLLPLAASYSNHGSHPQEQQVIDVADECRGRLGHAVEAPFLSCVVDELLNRQKAAKAEGAEYYPVGPHHFDPWAPKRGAVKDANSEQLKELLRNYSCDVEDGGSQPLRSMTWEYAPPDPCGELGSTDGAPPTFIHKSGFLPAGEDLSKLGASIGPMTEETAQSVCSGSKQCAGFTFHSPAGRSKSAKHTMHFKSASGGITKHDEWHTFKRLAAGVDCRPGFRPPPPTKMRLQIDVLRESPPVYIVHDFASELECEYMMNETLPRMAPSVVYGGGEAGKMSSYRQSFSVNMYPDYDDETHVITRMVRRKFAFAREVAEYEELLEGEGQEPLNSVYYKNWDDQYRPHCDGQCYGGPYRKGERIATSLTYCAVADQGGYTMFTRTGHKVVPKRGQMLFFGYKLPPNAEGGPPTMDNGHTEHTGCPLRKGQKWIATMWYREGMTAERDWTHYRTA